MRLFVILLVLFSILLYIDAKPTLDEEKRNLCEGESNLAECIQEVEDAKSTPATLISDTEETKDTEENKEDDESEEEDPYERIMKEREMIIKRQSDDDQNRAYWDEEYKSMNKWARYGIA